LHGKGDIAIVGIYRHLKSSAERETSFEATINASAPGIRVLRRALEESTASQEQRQVETILRSTPHLQAIVALSSSSTRGAFYALQTSGLVGKVHLIGFDQDLLAPLASGGIDAVVMQDTRAMGQQAVRLMVDMIEGRQHSNKVVLSPILATQQNYTSKEVSRVLTRSWYEP
jgi:ABC-type sugar transport system substrate-binding protein